mmetsp:Transcript_26462/g.78956  ORF Transcript_26462/g.78956 Transcript_26462/m.78956 type:complete len:310 (-) Transcript_26462:1223-2152(-)
MQTMYLSQTVCVSRKLVSFGSLATAAFVVIVDSQFGSISLTRSCMSSIADAVSTGWIMTRRPVYSSRPKRCSSSLTGAPSPQTEAVHAALAAARSLGSSMAAIASRILLIDPSLDKSVSNLSSIRSRAVAWCCSAMLSNGMHPSTSLTQDVSAAGRWWMSRSAPVARRSATLASCTERKVVFCSGPPSVRLSMMIGLADWFRMVVLSSAALRKAEEGCKIESLTVTTSWPLRHLLVSNACSRSVSSVTVGVMDARCQLWSIARSCTVRAASAAAIGRTLVPTGQSGSPVGTLHLSSFDRRTVRALVEVR